VLEGDTETTTDQRVSVFVHLDSMAADSLVWRGEPSAFGGQPITADGSTRFGEVMSPSDSNDKTVIRTYTRENGKVRLTAQEDPDLLDRASFEVAQYTLGLQDWVPTILGWVPPMGGGVGLIGLAGVARRRRAAEP